MNKFFTIITGVLLVFGLSLADTSPADPAAIGETALPALNPSPLLALDLYPTPVAAGNSRDYSALNLDPRSAALNTPIFRPQTGISGLGNSLFKASLLSYVALNVADFVSTRECLKYPHLAEGNPVMKPFVKNPYAFAAVKAGLGAVTYLSMKSLYKKSKPLAWAVSIASNLALSYVVSNNFRLLNQAKAR